MFGVVFGLACAAVITDVEGDSRWTSRNLNSWQGSYPTPRPVATWYSSDDTSKSDSSTSASKSASQSKSTSSSKSGSENGSSSKASASKSGSKSGSQSSSGSSSSNKWNTNSDSKSGSGNSASKSASKSASSSKTNTGSGSGGSGKWSTSSQYGGWSSSNAGGSSSNSGGKTSSSSSNGGAWSGRGYYVPSPTQSPTEEDPLIKATCHSDCIEVSGFDIDKSSEVGEYLESTFSSNMGGSSAFTGTYCWKDECDCYEKDYDANNMYDVSIELEHNQIMFDYMNAMGGIYQAKYSKHYYGDLGCIEDFFNSNGGKGGNWKLESSMFDKLDGEYIDVDPTFSSQYCYCVM